MYCVRWVGEERQVFHAMYVCVMGWGGETRFSRDVLCVMGWGGETRFSHDVLCAMGWGGETSFEVAPTRTSVSLM
jgi:hypothetical protein